jgi:hypothetical protein
VRRSASIACGALTLAPLLVVAACPSLGEIGVGSPPDATTDGRHDARPEAGLDVRREARVSDAGLDVRCDADAAQDPHNCGQCGHDCLGGTCAGGACQPVVLFSGDTPISIVVDGPTVFAAVQTLSPDTGYVIRCQAADCEATKTVVASGLAFPWFAVGEKGSLYWADFGGNDAAAAPGNVMGCPEKGCPEAGPQTYTPEAGSTDGSPNTMGLAADSTYLYWADTFGFDGVLYQCARGACAGTVAVVTDVFGVPYAPVVDSTHLYWVLIGSNQIQRCPRASCGGGPEVFAQITTAGTSLGFCGLAVFGGEVFFSQGIADGGVFSCPASGCGGSPKEIARGQANPSFIAADDSGVYWANTSGNTIMHCPLGGCAAPDLIATSPAPFAIALDTESVYFTNSSGAGQVLRVAK